MNNELVQVPEHTNDDRSFDSLERG